VNAMPVIRPVSDLRNKTPEIEEICIKEQKPVFITKNGSSHLVVMSQKLFEEQQALLDLYEKLDEAEEQSRSGLVRPFREVMNELRSRIHAKMSN
jgi:PHD/YefM family antitoxin component YafN of YafNO toxin-antitoxin module